MRYFTSDLHFYHTNVINHCSRPFFDTAHMNEELIKNWNSTVCPDDEVFILGDMFFCGTTRSKEIMKRLDGKKTLILGNHDWGKVQKEKPRNGAREIKRREKILLMTKMILKLSTTF